VVHHLLNLVDGLKTSWAILAFKLLPLLDTIINQRIINQLHNKSIITSNQLECMNSHDTTISPSLSTFQWGPINKTRPASTGKVITIATAGNMFEVKAISMWVAPETYIVNERAEAEELAMELRARQYKVEVSEIESED
jgi:hypothetical protein